MKAVSAYNEVGLTPRQEQDWQTSKALLLVATPAFAHILYELLSFGEHLAVFTDEIPIAATDGAHLMFNPKTFFALDAGERLFAMGHEILHCALAHPMLMLDWNRQGAILYPDGEKVPYVHALMNIAADFVVNAILIDAKIGKYKTDWYLDRNIATAADSITDVYRKLWRQAGRGGLAGAFEGVAFDEHLMPGAIAGKPPEQARAEASAPRHRRVIEAALDTARRQGALPGTLDRLLGKLLEPQVDWRERLASTVSRRIGNDRWSFELPNQEWLARDIYVPSRSSFGAADIVVGGDVSGSVSDEEHAMFGAELVGILEQLRPRRLFVVWCDAAVQRVDVVDAPGDIANLQPHPGGGGTSFVPVFEWIANQADLELDGLIYLTDGYGAFPRGAPPHYPVIWGSVTPLGEVRYPFGDVVEIPRRGTPRRGR